MRILTVSTTDLKGGASRVAWRLHSKYRGRGHQALLAVGRKYGNDTDTRAFNEDESRGAWYSFWHRASSRFQKGDTVSYASLAAMGLAEPGRAVDYLLGYEDFRHPATRRLLDITDSRPDIVHGHNLHGGYFDLRALPWLSYQAPVVLTLHDGWLLSGHCAHSFDCERWKSGCGDCPDLTIYPPVRRDATAHNWRRKKTIYAASRLFVSTPSEWLMNKVEASILAPASVETRVIPYGVDLSVYRPADKNAARRKLGLPVDARILLLVAPRLKRNPFKDYETARSALERLARKCRGERLLFLALGDDSGAESFEGAELRFAGNIGDEETVATYYQAADVYLHSAKADTFPNTVIEALACGAPVVATAVGGIPEQVRPLGRQGADAATGLLVPPGNAEEMAAALERLIEDEPLRHRLGANAADDARRRFDLESQVDTYLGWYEKLISDRQKT